MNRKDGSYLRADWSEYDNFFLWLYDPHVEYWPWCAADFYFFYFKS